jgi:predicted nucleotidyltransferase
MSQALERMVDKMTEGLWETSHGVVEDHLGSLRERHAADLEGAASGVVGQLRRIPEVHKVVLFGSYAAGRRDLFTDLDFLVVMDSDADFITRNAEMAGCIQCKVALDLLVYTPKEMEQMRKRPFISYALTTGKVMYEGDTA